MPYLNLPTATVEKKGTVITIESGDKPEFPKWFHDGLDVLIRRLWEERGKEASQATGSSVQTHAETGT
jgi:hypothetical protein